MTASARTRYGREVLIVLGLSLGQSAVYSILSIIEKLTRGTPLGQQTTTMNSSATPDRPWLDLAYQLAGLGFSLMPVALVLYLLNRDAALRGPGTSDRDSGGGRDRHAVTDAPSLKTASAGERSGGALIGFDVRRPVFDVTRGVALATAIGVPGLGLYLGAKALGLNTTVVAANLAENWWTLPVLVTSAAVNGVLEEVIMVGYLFRRFAQLPLVRSRWLPLVTVAASALIRGAYHLYQGFGGFAGNLIMGLVFGVCYLRWRRVAPLVVAHTVLDVAAFVGYALLAPRVGWLR